MKFTGEVEFNQGHGQARFDFNKMCNLYSTLTGQITFQLPVSFPEPTDLVSHFSFVIKC